MKSPERKTDETCICGSEMPWHIVALIGKKMVEHHCVCGRVWVTKSKARMQLKEVAANDNDS